MGFWSKLFGRTEYDTTVSDYQGEAALDRASYDRTVAAEAAAAPFRLVIEDTFVITGRGTVATGTVQSGRVAIGDRLTAQDPNGGNPVQLRVTGIEAFRRTLTVGAAGDHIGLLLGNTPASDLQRGRVLTAAEATLPTPPPKPPSPHS
ncbi:MULTISPECIES: EF-Tu/IF-2/RF-3 family GTPase [unclassified Plantibacter]|jgi:translation elongation factor EF-Tu-like GTPase|uniref:EF-Tu/IF-2/RF-3 family GTPase n=1 Tax=unclassified Plantibacter TaxID=2624265 RepID=UPI003D357CD5